MGWKSCSGQKLAYFASLSVTKKKRFMTLTTSVSMLFKKNLRDWRQSWLNWSVRPRQHLGCAVFASEAGGCSYIKYLTRLKSTCTLPLLDCCDDGGKRFMAFTSGLWVWPIGWVPKRRHLPGQRRRWGTVQRNSRSTALEPSPSLRWQVRLSCFRKGSCFRMEVGKS